MDRYTSFAVDTRSESPAVEETKIQTHAPLGIWKIALGVLIGNLLTGIVVSIVYAMTR